MKKFSKVVKNNDIINERLTEPNMDLKMTILGLVNDLLKIRMEGPIDPILEGTVKIAGKEDLVNAIIDLFRDKDIKKTLQLLEKVKFFGYDSVIAEIEKVNEVQTAGELTKHRKRIADILDRCGGDVEEAKKIAKRQADSIKNGEKAHYRGLAAEQMIADRPEDKKCLKEIYNIFSFRGKQLGFKNF